MCELGPEKSILNINAGTECSEKANAITACEHWSTYLQYLSGNATLDQITDFLNGPGKNIRNTTLNELLTGKLTNYCFVPEDAYLNNKNLQNGIVVDFKDIHSFPYDQLIPIQRGDYDYLRFLGDESANPLNQQFILETITDAVIIQHEIGSPWIERLMQNFAFSFIRIGVDTISKDIAKKYSKQTLTHNETDLLWITEEADEKH